MRFFVSLALSLVLTGASFAASTCTPYSWAQSDTSQGPDLCPAVPPPSPTIVASLVVQDVPVHTGTVAAFAPAPVPRGLSPPSWA